MAPVWWGFAPVFVAQDLGCFHDAKLDVNLKFADERADVMAAMSHGSIEMEMRTISEYQGRPRDNDTPALSSGRLIAAWGAMALWPMAPFMM